MFLSSLALKYPILKSIKLWIFALLIAACVGLFLFSINQAGDIGARKVENKYAVEAIKQNENNNKIIDEVSVKYEKKRQEIKKEHKKIEGNINEEVIKGNDRPVGMLLTNVIDSM